jgi:hypothetical protein
MFTNHDSEAVILPTLTNLVLETYEAGKSRLDMIRNSKRNSEIILYRLEESKLVQLGHGVERSRLHHATTTSSSPSRHDYHTIQHRSAKSN